MDKIEAPVQKVVPQRTHSEELKEKVEIGISQEVHLLVVIAIHLITP